MDRPIAFYPKLARALGGIEEAIFVQQLYYWSDKSKSKDGWVYKNRIEWERETTLTPKQQKRIVRHLKDLGMLETTLKKAKGAPTLHYKLANGLVQKVLIEQDERDHSIGTKGTNPPTEITTEITTEIIAAEAADPEKGKNETGKKIKVDPSTPMDLEGFILWCKKSTQRHIQIIADFAEEKKANFTTRGQWEIFISRNVRAARDLAPFTDEQIGKAIDEILVAEKDYLDKWSLETVLKYLIK